MRQQLREGLPEGPESSRQPAADRSVGESLPISERGVNNNGINILCYRGLPHLKEIHPTTVSSASGVTYNEGTTFPSWPLN